MTDANLLGILEDPLLARDPLAFVQAMFPWESDLLPNKGPELWQASILNKIRLGLLTPNEAIRQAIASGHGVGKSALVSWIIIWSISTMRDTRGVVTANTETQLKTKTWAELGKWFRMFLGKPLFKLTATAIFSAMPEHERTWRIDMVPWSERNTEAFAGLHNQGKRIVVIFDEASAIPDVIWETTEGALTDENTEILWLVCGNPTRNTGRFKDCFGRFRSRWEITQVDSRQVSFTNREQIREWSNDYGEDSDFVRIRVRGVFPRLGTMQFIPSDIVDAATTREVSVHIHDPLVVGVDVARFGDDASVIYIRKGRDGRSIAPIVLRGVDTMTLAGRVTEVYREYHADAVFVDGTGVGGGVVDRLRQLQVPIFDIQFGAKADRAFYPQEEASFLYANKRAEMWGMMRDWLKGGAIPDDNQLKLDLIGPQYGFNVRNEIQLERKEDMKRRGLESPDYADALALTFALPVIPNALAGKEGPPQPAVLHEYNPFDYDRKDYNPFPTILH
jgi:hypothetical protein